MAVIADVCHCSVSERTGFISLCSMQDDRYAALQAVVTRPHKGWILGYYWELWQRVVALEILPIMDSPGGMQNGCERLFVLTKCFRMNWFYWPVWYTGWFL